MPRKKAAHRFTLQPVPTAMGMLRDGQDPGEVAHYLLVVSHLQAGELSLPDHRPADSSGRQLPVNGDSSRPRGRRWGRLPEPRQA